MQRMQVTNAVDETRSAPRGGVSVPLDDAAAMAAALHRLANLRATLYRDWSDGPFSLVGFANADLPAKADVLSTRAYAMDAPDLAFSQDPAFSLEPPAAPLELRGRQACLDEMPPPAAAAEDDEPEELQVGAGAGADVAYLLDLVRALPKAPSIILQPAPLDGNDNFGEAPVLGVGAFADIAPLLVEAAQPTAVPVSAPIAHEPADIEMTFAVGAVADVAMWLHAPVERAAPVVAPEVATAEDIEADVGPFGVGAFAAAAAWLHAPVLEEPSAPRRVETAEGAVEDEALPVGGVADCLALDAPVLGPEVFTVATVTPEPEETVAEEPFGAIAGLAPLFALAPAPEIFTPPPVIDLEEIALDDFLADACEALYTAALDPTELYAWGASAAPTDDDGAVAAQLAALETTFWNLPRVIPCGEAFAFHSNHEIAVKITRALRIRADTLRARAFTETTGFGVLHSSDLHMPWFPSVEAPAGQGADTVEADTQFATWGMDELAVMITAPDRPMPILSEDELDALLAMPAARDSHELEDDWQENPVWRETFWHDVDAYLQTVEATDFEEAPATTPEILDIEIRDEPPPAAMHFWVPGSEADMAIGGEGGDMFLVGGGDAGCVLVEDGAIHSMRTGRGTRMGEVVVSWSTDPWTDIDAMTWIRVATLAGVAQVRVEQTVTHDRMVVVAGDLSGSPLTADHVRLIEATENGPREFPVRRIGGLDHGDAWPFADLGGPKGAPGGGSGEDYRVLV